MSKFYVQCGPIETILTADSAEQAAMAALDRALQAHLWIYDDPVLSEQECLDHLLLEALFHLDAEVRVSQRGFDRSDSESIGTPETVQRWHALMIGMKRMFIAAGLAPRSMSQVASSTRRAATDHPRRPR